MLDLYTLYLIVDFNGLQWVCLMDEEGKKASINTNEVDISSFITDSKIALMFGLCV